MEEDDFDSEFDEDQNVKKYIRRSIQQLPLNDRRAILDYLRAENGAFDELITKDSFTLGHNEYVYDATDFTNLFYTSGGPTY